MNVRTRMAPSPTGEFHIGGMRTLLFNYALALKNNGQFILRIEDTDQKRFVEGATERLMQVIRDYGLDWSEGPDVSGPYAPYQQSDRLEIYKRHAEELLEKGHAYYDFLTQEETQDFQKIFRTKNQRFRSPHRNLSRDEIQKFLNENRPYVIRLKVPENQDIVFEDLVAGKISINSNEVDDQVLLKQDGFPTYHLAVVIDDHLMKITHVMRGNEWISSTPKHILLYEAFGWSKPVYGHLPNLKEIGSGTKLSKRFGDVHAVSFLEKGYLPEALLNFLMFLGWAPKIERIHGEKEREIYSLEEFVNLFSLEGLQKTALVAFDREKLNWFNKEYLKMKTGEELAEILAKWIEKFDKDFEFKDDLLSDPTLSEKLELVKERARTLEEIVSMLDFFYITPKSIDWDIKQLKKVDVEKIPEIKKEIKSIFENFGANSDNWTHQEWEEGMRAIADKFEIKHGDAFMILRIAIVGAPVSPPLFEALQLLGKNEILKRLS